jgi:2-dehydropantoate 2-reductase
MKILVVGAGGVGGYFGARLAQSGNEVFFAVRGRHAAAMRERGLRVLTAPHEILVARPAIHEDPKRTGPCDVVLLCTKMYSLDEAIEVARPVLHPTTAVITLQNGVEGPGRVAEILGADHAVGGVARIFAHIAEPGVIAHESDFAQIFFGEMDRSRSRRLEDFLSVCEGAGVDAVLSEDIERHLWTKFIILTGTAGATAYYRMTTGEILGDPERRAFFEALVRETGALARAKGVALSGGLEDELIAGVAAMPKTLKASMATDLEQGNRLELPWLNGAVVRLSQAAGVPTPTHAEVVRALEPFVEGRAAAP